MSTDGAYQVEITFPGVLQIRALEATITHGITPSTFTLTIAPQEALPDLEEVALTISDGEITRVWEGCKVDAFSYHLDSHGMIVQFSIFDRRWKWTDTTIRGEYNLRLDVPETSIQPLFIPTEKTPQQLLALLLDAIGEEDYSIGRAPNSLRPQVQWDGGSAAGYLAELCDLLGCLIVLGADDNVTIYNAGQGVDLPFGSIMEDSLSYDLPEVPAAIGVQCGPTRYQVDLPLEPVGEETNGQILPITDLSYEPDSGWSFSDFPFLYSLRGQTPLSPQWLGYRLAIKSVLRWYRPILPFQVVEYGQVNYRFEVAQLLQEQCEAQANQIDIEQSLFNNTAFFEHKEAQIYGVWNTQGMNRADNLIRAYPLGTPLAEITGLNGNIDSYTDPIYFYDGGFSVDPITLVVKFGEIMNASSRVVNWAVNGVWRPAMLWLRTSVIVRAKKTHAPVKWQQIRNLIGTDETPPNTLMLRHDELERCVKPYYASEFPNVYDVAGEFEIISQTENTSLISQECDYYIDAKLAEYQQPPAETRKYAGLVNIDLDGAIQQISYSLGTEGFTTFVARSTERIIHHVPYAERRMLERSRELAHMKKQIEQQQLRFERGWSL